MLNFTKNFATDFDQLAAGLIPSPTNPGLPFAFSRYGDGEAAIMFGKCHRAKSDGWDWRGQQPQLSNLLLDSLHCTTYGYYIGIVAESHDSASHHDLLKHCRLPDESVTFAEIFNFSNYKRFRELPLRDRCFWVGPSKCDADVPADAVMTGWDWKPLVKYLVANVRKPIIVAAGPLANVIVHQYWLATANKPSARQTIVDVGSAISQVIHSRRTRQYHHAGHHLASWSPSWKMAELPRKSEAA